MEIEKKIAFVFNTINTKEFVDSIKKDKPLIICANDDINRIYSDLGFDVKTIMEYSSDPELENKKAVEWMKDWPDKPILNGKSFKELLIYDDLSIFWFLETRFYIYRIQSLIPLIMQIQNVINFEKPTSIWIKGSNDIHHIIRELCENKLKKLEFIQSNKKKDSTSYKSHSGNRSVKLLALKLFRGFTPFSKVKEDDRNPVLIITEIANWRKDYDYEEKKTIQKDAFFHDIIKNLRSSSIPIRIIDFENQPGRLLKSHSINKDRQKAFDTTVEAWEKYLNSDILAKTKEFNKKLETLWEKIKNSEELKKSLTFDGIPLYDILKEDVEALLKSFKTYTSVSFIEAAKRILDTIKPSVILMHDEYGTLQLSLIKEAKKRNIPTISIQHGANTETWISYVHKIQHVKDESGKISFPLPQKMCVWSNKAKGNLLKFGNFPNNIPEVTGDPKIDFLPKAIQQFNSTRIKEKLNIPTRKKIILFATQTLPNLQEKELITKSVFESIKNLQDVYLIIKAHPNETGLSFYKKIADENDVSNYTIQQFSSLYELLYIANVVIVPYSTVGLEGMRMKKPVITLNLLGLHNDDPLIKSGFSQVVKNQSELLPILQKCLEPIPDSKILESSAQYSENEIGLVDGKASERITNLILELKSTN